MSRIDWQAYLDGSLSPEAIADAERALRDDPAATREFEGLQAFRAALREAGAAEPVPEMRLEALLQRTASQRTVLSRRRFSIAGSMALAAAAIWAFFALDLPRYADPLRLDHSPTREMLLTANPTEAAQWVSTKVGFNAPAIDLGTSANLTTIRRGDGWACYDYEVDGKAYYLYMCPNPEGTGDAPSITLPNGKSVLKGRGLRWRQNGMCYYLRGPDDEVEARLAVQAMERIEAHAKLSSA